MNKHFYHIIIPSGLILLLLIWKPGVAGMWISPVLLLASVFYLCRYALNWKMETKGDQVVASQKSRLQLISLFSLLSLITVYWAHIIYSLNPIDITKSDIIPLIKEVYINRLLSGEFVYGPVSGFDYVNWTPNYLPFHWMPFIPAYVMGFDPRWISTGMILFASAVYFNQILKLQTSFTDKLIKTIFPFVILFSIFIKQTLSVAHNVELLIAGFYMILISGFINNNRTSIITGYTSTLLSRYISVFFIPLDLIDSIRKKNKPALYSFAFILILIAIFYIIPFLSSDPMIFLNGTKAYDIAALGEWDGQAWQQPGDRPYQLFQGYGFASWIYHSGPGELIEKIGLTKVLLLTVMFVYMIVFLIIQKRFAKHLLFKPVALFAALCLFPSFSLVPYNYLFWSLLFALPVLIMRIPLTDKKSVS